ncbi:hypothetical protein Taro_016032 [Colocasia esculenta]|uniref:Uncharacterized protein n=1 Tax=Colocasia esculenta TaxID=4460 RepID=A0A843UCX3_COLES|nr:hypothetical protein [Colocasia esculenta]
MTTSGRQSATISSRYYSVLGPKPAHSTNLHHTGLTTATTTTTHTIQKDPKTHDDFSLFI